MALSTSHLPSMIAPHHAAQPTPIQPNYPFTVQNIPRIACYYHNDQLVQYFCKEPQCLMPLCQVCLQVHEQEHQNQQTRSMIMTSQYEFIQGNILPLEACLTETYNNMARQANQMVVDYEKLWNLTQYHSQLQLGQGGQVLLTNPLALIESTRKQIHDIVDNYFNSLVTYIMSRAPQMNQRTIDSTPIINDIRGRWEEIIRELEILNSQQTLQQIIHYYSGEVTSENDKVIQAAQLQIQQYDSLQQQRPLNLDIPQLKVDPRHLPEFLIVLEKYASFNSPVPLSVEQPVQQPVQIQQPIIQQRPIIISESRPPTFISYGSPPPPPMFAPPMYGPPMFAPPISQMYGTPRRSIYMPSEPADRYPYEYEDDYYPNRPEHHWNDREPYMNDRYRDREPYYEDRYERSDYPADARNNYRREQRQDLRSEAVQEERGNVQGPFPNMAAVRRVKRSKSSRKKQPTNIVIHHVQDGPSYPVSGVQPYATISNTPNLLQVSGFQQPGVNSPIIPIGQQQQLQQQQLQQQQQQQQGTSRLQNRAYL